MHNLFFLFFSCWHSFSKWLLTVACLVFTMNIHFVFMTAYKLSFVFSKKIDEKSCYLSHTHTHILVILEVSEFWNNMKLLFGERYSSWYLSITNQFEAQGSVQSIWIVPVERSLCPTALVQTPRWLKKEWSVPLQSTPFVRLVTISICF